MKITTDNIVPVTAEIVTQATADTGRGMIAVGPLKFKHMRIHEDAEGWYVMRGRGRKVRIVSARIMAIDGHSPTITFNLCDNGVVNALAVSVHSLSS